MQNKSTYLPPTKETIDLLAQNSGGDIRTAINGLQFSCLKGEGKLYYNYLTALCKFLSLSFCKLIENKINERL